MLAYGLGGGHKSLAITNIEVYPKGINPFHLIMKKNDLKGQKYSKPSLNKSLSF